MVPRTIENFLKEVFRRGRRNVHAGRVRSPEFIRFPNWTLSVRRWTFASVPCARSSSLFRVGLSCNADGNCRAFIGKSNLMRDLNDFKPAGYTATLEQARDINEAVEIAGRSLDSFGIRKVFLARPVNISPRNNPSSLPNKRNTQSRRPARRAL
jgi:hypothetical protein